jgi:cellulose synthase/poly-beta-1,6-N-acetylglucosamine synthase-like glycosyltransferase
MGSRQVTGSHFPLVVDKGKNSDSLGTLLQEQQKVSIIIPTLNESGNITDLLLRLDVAMVQANILYEAIIVDDHSHDDTCDIALRIAQNKQLPVRVLTKQGQPGKAFSLMEGFAASRYNLLAFIDGDLQYPPESLPEMINKLDQADIVVGDRRITYDGAGRFRAALSGIFTSVINIVFRLDTDMQSGMKVFHRKVYDEMEGEPGKWNLDLHLIIQAIHKGYKIANVPIIYAQRQAGESKVIPLAVAIELLMTVLMLKLTTTTHYILRGGKTSRKIATGHKYVIAANAPVSEQVNYYSQWLDADTQRGYAINSTEAIEEYRDIALRTTEINGKEVAIFAPFRQKLSALRTFLPSQILTLCLIALLIVLGLVFFPVQTLVAGVAIITVFYFVDLVVNFVMAAKTLDSSIAEKIDDELVYELKDANWPAYTVLCPLYREAAVVPQFVDAMQKLDYPTDRLQVLFLTELDDVETRDAIRAMSLPSHFNILTVPDGQPRTKPRACNYGLLHAKGRYVVIFDAEDSPDPLQLKKAVLTFANHGPDVACVQAKLNFYNADQNLLTRWFTAEYSLWFDLTLPGLQRAGFPLPLGGTSNHFRTEMLRTLGAWDAFNVTEDCDLGLRLAHYKLKTIVLDSTTYEEANSQVKNWIRQRSRWIKGYMQTYLVYMRNPLRYLRAKHWDEFLSLQLIVGGKTAVLFVNPLMWLLLLAYVFLRPFVGPFYHTLFPMPVLYMGTMCLVFGNFFYTYTHLFGCIDRGRYGLVKWTLLIPLYWMLTSVAACVALQQLIFKPHYWEKTQHGLHLLKPHASATDIQKHQEVARTIVTAVSIAEIKSDSSRADEEEVTPFSETVVLNGRRNKNGVSNARRELLSKDETLLLPMMAHKNHKPVPTVTDLIKSTFIIPMPVVHHQKRARRWLVPEDKWLLATFITACIASFVAMYYFFTHNQTLLYGDAYAHMMIARRLFDNITPGVAQLGGVWLPLPHLVMLPFIWNDTLWRTGLAGSIPSMLCYIVASVYIFLFARSLTHDSRASFVGTLLFMLNPNILYLQTTPLSELLLIATLSASCYYFQAWVQKENSSQLIKASVAIFLATLARYDGWALFLALVLMIVVIGLQRRHSWTRIEGNLLVFGSFGSLGIILWFVWCGVIFGDPLYFQHGPFSAQAQQADLRSHGVLFTYHNLQSSILVYLTAIVRTIGPGLFVLGVLSLLILLVKRRISPDVLVALASLAPLAFYVYSLYSGQAALFMPGAVPANSPYHLFNARYGAQVVAPAALFLAFLAHLFTPSKRMLRSLWQGALVVTIIVQSVLVVMTGIITLQDGQFGTNCFSSHPIEFFLVQHYNGGRILTDDYTSQDDALEPEAGIHFSNVIYEGSAQLWPRALKTPTAFVDWVIVNPKNPQDMITSQLKQNPMLLSSFTRVLQEKNGLSLYHKNGMAALPTRPLPSSLLTEHSLCNNPGSGQNGDATLFQQPSDHTHTSSTR